MKINRTARRIRNLRITLLCLAIAVLVGIEFAVGQSLAGRFGQATAGQTQGPQAPQVGISDLMAALR